jgi:hypothetical protein
LNSSRRDFFTAALYRYKDKAVKDDTLLSAPEVGTRIPLPDLPFAAPIDNPAFANDIILVLLLSFF